MDWTKTFGKTVLGFFTGLAAVIVMGVSQSITNYNPTICTAEITTNCTPQFVVSIYAAIVPAVTGFLVGLANYLKNRNK